MALSLAKLAGATLMVALTTADDAVWLVSYTSPTLPLYTRIIHGVLFVLTLEALVCACVGLAMGCRWAVVSDTHPVNWPDEEVILGSIGAGICWVIAGVLFVKKWMKRRRRAEAQSILHRATTQKVSNHYGSVSESDDKISDEEDASSSSSSENDGDDGEISSRPSPWAVISFTTLGALDEVSYFPSLLLGNMFTPLDLCLGTFFAACIVLIVVTLFLSQCRPVLDFLDRIPLYGIIATFAVVLTAGVIVDVVS